MAIGNTRRSRKALARLLLFAGFVFLGIVLKIVLSSLREPPRLVETTEPTLEVEVVRAQPEDVPVVITGFGEVRCLNIVAITPKVAGEVVAIHPRLEQGEVIAKGELLFRIDPTDYETLKAQAEAQVRQLESAIALLKKRFEIDKGRVDTFTRTRDLAQLEFERDKALYEDADVGTESMVNLSEVTLNQAEDAYDQIEQAIELYPLRIREAESGLAAAKAQLQQALTSIERTEIRAAFDARVKLVQVELGQNVAPGPPVLILADDSALEISVPLDSRDARSWLPFLEDTEGDGSWFGPLEPVQCRISWTEDSGEHYWPGTLDRVERFDQMTRTVPVAIRIDGKAAASAAHGLPLVDGMYCRVKIPGRTMRQVYRLPRWAVTFEGQVYVAENQRLRRREVAVVRNQGEEAFVSSGIETDDLVVITRLVNPLPGSLLAFTVDEAVVAGDGVCPAAGEPDAETGS